MSDQPDDVRKAIEFFNSEHDDSGLIEYGRVLLGEIARLQSILSRLPMSRICSAHREPGNYECRTCYPMLEPVTQTQANGERQ